MAQGQGTKNESDSQNAATGEKKKEGQKDHTPTKILIRRLPPSLTPEEFLEQVSPLPDYDFFYFVRADMSLGPNAFTRAYINFKSADDIFIFRDKFDGYVFLDAKGGEYPAIVEFAPFQKVPKKKPKKTDSKAGLIEQDADYKKFLENLSKPTETLSVSLDAMVVEVEAKENMLAKSGSTKVSTPLLEYIRRKREERKLNIAKLKEERRRGGRERDLERKRSGKGESDKRRSEKERLRDRDRDRRRDRNRDRLKEREKDRRREKDVQKTEKSKDERGGEKKLQREEGAARPAVMLLKNTDRDSQTPDKKGTADKKAGQTIEREDEEREWQQDSQTDNDQGKGQRKRDDRLGKRGAGEGGRGGGRWAESREGERSRQGRKDRGRGGEEERDRFQSGKGQRSYRDDKDFRNYKEGKEMKSYRDDKEQKSYREDKDSRRGRPYEERGGGDRFPGKDRGGGGSNYGKEDKGGGRDRYREDRGGGGDRRGGGGDGWRKKENEGDRRKAEKEKPRERRPESGRVRGKEDGKKEGEGGYTKSKDSHAETAKDEKEKQRDVPRIDGGGESDERKTGRSKIDADSYREGSGNATYLSKPGMEGEDERGAGMEGDERKRKRKERPERQIYIPRKALERQRQGSPQLTGKGSDEKAPDTS